MSSSPIIDPATVEVIRHYFVSAATEMERTLGRTAYTTIIYEINDFGISIFDKKFNLIADSAGLPLFLGANEFAIRKSLEHTKSDPLEPGDVLFMNVPYWTGAHSNDGVLIAPAFVDGEIVAYGVIRAHWTDIGGKDPGYNLDTRSIHQEGLMIPGEKIVRRGEPNAELLRVMQANSRSPITLLGDFNAEVAALRVGTNRIVELNKKYGVETVQAATDARQAAWFAVSDLPTLAFDHEHIFEVAFERLQGKVRYEPIGFELLPKKFALRQLQEVYEKILERPLDKRNFRKKVLSMALLIELDEIEQDVAHRAARLYRFDERKYKRLAKQGFLFEV